MSIEWAVTLIVLVGIVAAILGYEYGRNEDLLRGTKAMEDEFSYIYQRERLKRLVGSEMMVLFDESAPMYPDSMRFTVVSLRGSCYSDYFSPYNLYRKSDSEIISLMHALAYDPHQAKRN